MTPARCAARIRACAVQQDTDPLNGIAKIFAAAGVTMPPAGDLYKAMDAAAAALDEIVVSLRNPPPQPSVERPPLSRWRSPSPLSRRALQPSALRPIDVDSALAFWDFRDRLAGDIRRKKVRPILERMVEHAAVHYGLEKSDAVDWCSRFLEGLGRDLNRGEGLYT